MKVIKQPFPLQQTSGIEYFAPGVAEPVTIGYDLVEVDPFHPH